MAVALRPAVGVRLRLPARFRRMPAKPFRHRLLRPNMVGIGEKSLKLSTVTKVKPLQLRLVFSELTHLTWRQSRKGLVTSMATSLG
jgi:hypothetical protein